MAAAAADLAALNCYLEVCGINTPARRNAFINGQGLSSIGDFASFTTKDAQHVVKMHNNSTQANHKLGFLVCRNIEALIYHVCDHMH